MPPRAKITKDMIIDAAFEIARESGEENMSRGNWAVLHSRSCGTSRQ